MRDRGVAGGCAGFEVTRVQHQPAGAGSGSVFRVHEEDAANVTFVVSGQAIEIGGQPTDIAATDNQDFFINSIHGIRVTYTNTLTPPPGVCDFSTFGGFVLEPYNISYGGNAGIV